MKNKDMVNNDWRVTPPVPLESKTVGLGEYQSFDLSNGLKVILVENHKRPNVSLQLSLNHDPILQGDEVGYVSISGDLISKGTKYRSKSELDNAIDFIGAKLTTNSSGLYAHSLKKHLNELLDIISEIIQTPSFPIDEFEKSKLQAISGLRMSTSNADAMISTIGDFVRYGKNHPYGEIQTIETTERIKLSTCKSYFEQYFRPNNAYLIIVGSVNLSEAKDLANKYFAKWESRKIPRNIYDIPTAPKNRKVIFIHKEDAAQSVINITYPVNLVPNSSDIIKSRVLNSILGGGIFSGRLMKNLREDKAYTYGARSVLVADPLVGYFNAYANVGNDVTADSVTQFIYELNRLISSNVTEEELELVKNSLTGSFARSLESPQTIALFARNTFKYNLDSNYYNDYIKNINSVTINDIKEMAIKYLKPENSYVVVVGDKSIVSDSILKFDTKGKIDYYDPFGNLILDNNIKYRNVTYRDIFADYLSKIGGLKKLNNILSMTQLWKLKAKKLNSNISMSWLDNCNYAFTFETDGNIIQSNKYDGKKLTIDFGDQIIVKTSGIEFDNIKEDSIIFNQLRYIDKDFDGLIEFDGTENIDNQDCYKLLINSSNNQFSIEYYSINSKLLIKKIVNNDTNDGIQSIITKFKHYKLIGDILFPHQMEITGASAEPLLMSLEETKININLDKSIFK